MTWPAHPRAFFMVAGPMKRHPSGRPIRRREVKPLSIPRPPPDEPLTPGLRKPDGFAHAVGFHAHVGGRWDEMEDEDE